MRLWAHHLGVEFFGHEFAPETFTEHLIAFTISGLVLALLVYGAYAALRDLRRWLQRGRGGVPGSAA